MIEFIDQVLIQKYIDRDNESLSSAEIGFKELGIPTQRFDSKTQLELLPLTKSTLVCGGIGTVRHALSLIGSRDPEMIDYPEELNNFYGRRIWKSTLGQIRQEDVENIFIKPISQKLFVGHVRSNLGYLIQTAPFENDLNIWCSDPISFVSEYRTYVSNEEIVGLKHYKGDFLTFPDTNVIKNCVNLMKPKYKTYSLDVGITSNEQTLVVEVNDAFSLGSYGLPCVTYAQMLINRWLEIVNNIN